LPALRVIIGEDDVLMRAGLARLLGDAGVCVVAEAGDAPDLLRKAMGHKPDVAICDVQMPPGRQEDGLEVAIEIRRALPSVAVLVLSQYHEPSYALRLIGDRPDGVGYLLKERVGRVASFVEAVERVAAGGSALDPVVVARMLNRQQRGDPLGRLTGREHQVLSAMAEGKSNMGIAAALSVTEAAVEKHVTSIFRKLELGADTTEHRRVRAVLTYVRGRATARPLTL
jgi:DNA-binding NarL/FixJ family response regulator